MPQQLTRLRRPARLLAASALLLVLAIPLTVDTVDDAGRNPQPTLANNVNILDV